MKKVLLEYLVILIIIFKYFTKIVDRYILKSGLYEGINVYAKETLYSLFSNKREIKLDFLRISRKSIKYIDKVKI